VVTVYFMGTHGGADVYLTRFQAQHYIAVSGQLHVTSAFPPVDHLEDPAVDGKIILRWTFRK